MMDAFHLLPLCVDHIQEYHQELLDNAYVVKIDVIQTVCSLFFSGAALPDPPHTLSPPSPPLSFLGLHLWPCLLLFTTYPFLGPSWLHMQVSYPYGLRLGHRRCIWPLHAQMHHISFWTHCYPVYNPPVLSHAIPFAWQHIVIPFPPLPPLPHSLSCSRLSAGQTNQPPSQVPTDQCMCILPAALSNHCTHPQGSKQT